ncbi:MAG: hypothetical protein QGI45_04645 [Myxococcota bacterium]|nr:hypothetical protein [Myxococcota bacterium]
MNHFKYIISIIFTLVFLSACGMPPGELSDAPDTAEYGLMGLDAFPDFEDADVSSRDMDGFDEASDDDATHTSMIEVEHAEANRGLCTPLSNAACKSCNDKFNSGRNRKICCLSAAGCSYK